MDAGAHGLSGPIAREFVEEGKGQGTVSVTSPRLRTVGETVQGRGSRLNLVIRANVQVIHRKRQ